MQKSAVNGSQGIGVWVDVAVGGGVEVSGTDVTITTGDD
jgi:hypothetical protein